MVNDKTVPPPPLFDVVFEADLSLISVDEVIGLAEISMRSSPTRRADNLKELNAHGKITLCTCARDLAETYAQAASLRLQRWASKSASLATCTKPLFTIKLVKNV